jgi:hypothetical protein
MQHAAVPTLVVVPIRIQIGRNTNEIDGKTIIIHLSTAAAGHTSAAGHTIVEESLYTNLEGTYKALPVKTQRIITVTGGTPDPDHGVDKHRGTPTTAEGITATMTTLTVTMRCGADGDDMQEAWIHPVEVLAVVDQGTSQLNSNTLTTLLLRMKSKRVPGFLSIIAEKCTEVDLAPMNIEVNRIFEIIRPNIFNRLTVLTLHPRPHKPRVSSSSRLQRRAGLTLAPL